VLVLVSGGLDPAPAGADAVFEPFPGTGFSAPAAVSSADAFYLAERHVTISWRVRTHVPGMALRLYRGDLDGGLVLLAERVIEPGGVRTFRQEDVFDGVVPFFYLLRLVEPSGEETELASRLCVPLGIGPAEAAATTPSSVAAVLTETIRSFQLVMSGRLARGDVVNRGLRPEPPTPPPRS
jgi:hypothetical protein